MSRGADVVEEGKAGDEEVDKTPVDRTESSKSEGSVARPSFVQARSKRPKWLFRELTTRRVVSKYLVRKQVHDTGVLDAVQRSTSDRPLPKDLEDSLELTRLSFSFDALDKISAKPIGSGCQALVHRVDHYEESTQKPQVYAIKALRPELTRHGQEIRAFQREVNLLSLLHHEGICRLIGVGSTPQETPCAMLEWVDSTCNAALELKNVGEDSKIRRQVIMNWPSRKRVHLMLELVEVMIFLHSGAAIRGHSVLHRDLKPENYGVTVNGKFKLLDFGLAVCLHTSGDDRIQHQKTARYNLTQCTGSPRYMAPEVGKGLHYGLSADVYSWAVAAWEVLALQGKPYAGMNVAQHGRMVINGSVRPPIPSTWHPILFKLFSAAWALDADARPDFRDIRRLLILSLEADDATDPLHHDINPNSAKAPCC